VILADKLGFHDAFIGEHLSDACERVTNSMMFLASVASETKNIRLGTGTSNLSQMHPTLIAAQGPCSTVYRMAASSLASRRVR
jgi:alkanesulfonate monooxygenase SsuD/methylene tetrahydromethanopterin reductase-like flavin-dependent oxidoreductase (luciferase family)